MIIQPVMPAYNKGQTVTTGAASAAIVIGAGSKQLVLSNRSTNACYVQTFNSADGTIAASAADFCVLANSQVTITKDEAHDSLAYIQETGATTLHVIPGEGF